MEWKFSPLALNLMATKMSTMVKQLNPMAPMMITIGHIGTTSWATMAPLHNDLTVRIIANESQWQLLIPLVTMAIFIHWGSNDSDGGVDDLMAPMATLLNNGDSSSIQR
jgi:hypothetical protein